MLRVISLTKQQVQVFTELVLLKKKWQQTYMRRCFQVFSSSACFFLLLRMQFVHISAVSQLSSLLPSAETHTSRCSLRRRYSWSRIIDFGTDSRYFRVFWHYLRGSNLSDWGPYVWVSGAERKVRNWKITGSEARGNIQSNSAFVTQMWRGKKKLLRMSIRSESWLLFDTSHCDEMRGKGAEGLLSMSRLRE